MAFGPQKVTAPKRRSPRPRGTGVVGRPLHSPLLIVTLDLVLDAGICSAGGQQELEWLSLRGGGPQEGPPALPGPVGGTLTPDCTESTTRAELALLPLLSWSSLYKQWFLSPCTPGSLVQEMRAPLLPVPPSPTQAPHCT